MKYKGTVLAIVLICGIVAAILFSGNRDRPQQRVASGLEAPPFELKDTGGRLWKTGDLRGKVVLINFWASWCDTCKEELPSIQNLVNINRNNSSLVFVSILYEDKPLNALSYLKTKGFDFPVLVDDNNIAGLYGITGVPETFVIDKKGIVRQKVVGPLRWDSAEVKSALERLEEEK